MILLAMNRVSRSLSRRKDQQRRLPVKVMELGELMLLLKVKPLSSLLIKLAGHGNREGKMRMRISSPHGARVKVL